MDLPLTILNLWLLWMVEPELIKSALFLTSLIIAVFSAGKISTLIEYHLELRQRKRKLERLLLVRLGFGSTDSVPFYLPASLSCLLMTAMNGDDHGSRWRCWSVYKGWNRPKWFRQQQRASQQRTSFPRQPKIVQNRIGFHPSIRARDPWVVAVAKDFLLLTSVHHIQRKKCM